MTVDPGSVPELPRLEPWEVGKPLPRFWGTGRDMPWWFALLLMGDSAPMEPRKIQEVKAAWDEADSDGAVTDLRARFGELQSSTLDNFVRLSVFGAILAAVLALNVQTAAFILDASIPLPCKVVSWLSIGTAGGATVCALIMVVPKFKEWRRFKPSARDDVGKEVLDSRRQKGWPEYVRLMHRYAHRIQLITFERRVKNTGCLLIGGGFVFWVVALTLA